METSWLLSNCSLSLLTREVIDSCHPFTCGTDDDMDEFFRNDALEVLRFYKRNGFTSLFPHEIDEDLYTKPHKDETDRTERRQHPRRLRTRLMFCDLLEE